MEPLFDYQFRVILIGDSMVGKSSLLKYFTEGKFLEACDSTVGVDFFARLIEVKPGARVKLQLWDTAGQERFRSITTSYYRNSVGVLLVYDVTNRHSFDHLVDWLEEIKSHVQPLRVIFMLVGHKCDLDSERVVSQREGRQFAEFHGLTYIETSAKTGRNVEDTFLTIARTIYEQVDAGQLRAEEGWDGIKKGFSRPKETFHVTTEYESDSLGSKCC